jgi:hypothetical protein
MNTLVDLAISAHGGMDRRKRLSTVSAHLRVGGVLWAFTGKEGFRGDVNFEAELPRERFVKKAPQHRPMPETVWINPPKPATS